jgi:3-phenylpropionate/trans-cinnamate dioxygenase ferredoxin subunit
VAATKVKKRVSFPKGELEPGTSKTVTVGRREIAVSNVDGKLYAVFNRCPHMQAPLSRGRLAGAPAAGPVGELEYEPDVYVLRCPWHHYEFDLRTGACLADPSRLRVATYEVQEEGDEIALYV